MNAKELYFFDKDGYNYNFNWDASNKYWEGTIYLPKVSVGLYANATIYILEKTNNGFLFPQSDETNKQFVFKWDPLNKFVDEFFMFNFDDTYVIKDTSALTYTPNDGPECETLIVNRFDEYDVDLDSDMLNKALPVHIAFMANERYDATTYARMLLIYCNGKTIARIKFLAETVEEDERLKVWNDNLGYKITPEDTIIFKTSDIKEYMPDYQLLNEKRKELMLEGSNIYPYIGSYRAIINAIKFFGYNNLSIIEYWKNVNPSDINFGKIYHSSKYSLTKKETLRVGSRTIVLPNKDYKKINQLALVYTINHPTGKVDMWELPEVVEDFTYTIEEALIKLFALRKKLNKEFMPGTSRIIDIIGEANYFGLIGLTKTNMTCHVEKYDTTLKPAFESNAGKYVHLTDDRYFDKYIIEKQGYTPELNTVGALNQFNVIGDIENKTITELSETSVVLSTNSYPENSVLCQLYKDYYNEVFINHTRIEHYDDTDVDDVNAPSSAKFVLTNKTYTNSTFGGNEITFGYSVDTYISDSDYDYTINWGDCNGSCNHNCDSDPSCKCNHITFGNVDTFGHESTKWTIKMSENQYDSDLKNVGIEKKYVKHNGVWEYNGEDVFVKLPYIGYYDVTLTIDDTNKTFNRSIKVEPYNIEIKGFYYDARKLPSNIITNTDTAYNDFVLGILQKMTAWAVAERTSSNFENEKGVDFSMPTYTTTSEVVHTGPYIEKEREEWSVMDNVNEEITHLYPLVKYARYIKNGVDVKPYTWFLLGYEYSRIAGMCEPVWTIINNGTGDEQKYEGNYLTFLLKKEGNYTIKLTLKDSNGNIYEVSRNIFVVSYGADYKLYQSLKRDYDFLVEQKQLGEIHGEETSDKDDGMVDDTTKSLSFKEHSIKIEGTDGVVSVVDENNIGWELQTDVEYDWLSYAPVIGKGNQEIKITVSKGSARSAILYLNDWYHNTMDSVLINVNNNSGSDSGSDKTGTLSFGDNVKSLIMTKQDDGSGLASIEIKNESNIEYTIHPSVSWVSYRINSKNGKLEISCTASDFEKHKGEIFQVSLKDKYGTIQDSITVMVNTAYYIFWTKPQELEYTFGIFYSKISVINLTDLEITLSEEGDLDLSTNFNEGTMELQLSYETNPTTKKRTKEIIITGTRIDTGERIQVDTCTVIQKAAPESSGVESSIVLTSDKLSLNYYASTATNPIVATGVAGLSATVTDNSGNIKDLSVSISDTNDAVNITYGDNLTENIKSATITVTGTKTDGVTTISKSFKVEQTYAESRYWHFLDESVTMKKDSSISGWTCSTTIHKPENLKCIIEFDDAYKDWGIYFIPINGEGLYIIPATTPYGFTIVVENNDHLGESFKIYAKDTDGNIKTTLVVNIPKLDSSLTFENDTITAAYNATIVTNTVTATNLTDLTVSVETGSTFDSITPTLTDNTITITFTENTTTEERNATIKVSGKRTDNGEEYSKVFIVKQGINTEPSITFGYTDLVLEYYGTTTTNNLEYKNLTDVGVSVVENSGNIKNLEVSISTSGNNNVVNITYGDNLTKGTKSATIKVAGIRTDNGDVYDKTFTVTQNYTTNSWYFDSAELNLIKGSSGNYFQGNVVNKPAKLEGIVGYDDKYSDWGICVDSGGIKTFSTYSNQRGFLISINNSNHMGESFEIYVKDSDGTTRATCKVNIPSSTS